MDGWHCDGLMLHTLNKFEVTRDLMHTHVGFSLLDRFIQGALHVQVQPSLKLQTRTYVLHLGKINQVACLPACYTLEC